MDSQPLSSGPFSVAEFGNLVALAFQLESHDCLSHTLLRFGDDNPEDPVKLQPGDVTPPSSRSTTPTSPASPQRSSKMDFVTAPASSPSRSRQLLNKIKRHASVASNIRHETKERRTTIIIQPRISTTSLLRHSPVSFFEDSSDSDEDFTPSCSPSLASHRPETPKPIPSHGGFSIFSRPPSAITRPGTVTGRDSPDSDPPSSVSSRARSNSSSSTASTITDHACRTPTTPMYGVFITSGIPDDSANSKKSSSIDTNEWSLYAEDIHPPSASEDGSLYSSYTFPDHPFAAHDPGEDDPFAKNAVQVVRSSIDNFKPRRTRRRRASPTILPPTPPPSCPLPATPRSSVDEAGYFLAETQSMSVTETETETSSVTSSSTECDGSCEGCCEDENCDWTLGLGALPQDDAKRLSSMREVSKLEKKRCRSKSTPENRRRSGAVTVESVNEFDWTLSLPLKRLSCPGKPRAEEGSKADHEDDDDAATVEGIAVSISEVAPIPSPLSSDLVYARKRRASGAPRLISPKLSLRHSPSLQLSLSSPCAASFRASSLRTAVSSYAVLNLPAFPSSSALATGASASFNLPPSFPSTPTTSEDELTDTYASALSSPSRYSQSSMSRYSLTSAFPSPPTTAPSSMALKDYPFPSPPTILPLPMGAAHRPQRARRITPLLPIGPTPTGSPPSSPRSLTSSMTSVPRTLRKSASSLGSQFSTPRTLKTVKSERDVSAAASVRNRRESDYYTARESMSSQASM